MLTCVWKNAIICVTKNALNVINMKMEIDYEK